jgi:hypothetical protein
MKKLVLIAAVSSAALVALAINPSIRVGKFKNAEKLVIKKGTNEPYTIFDAAKSSGFGRMFKIQTQESGPGRGEYRVEFWRLSDRKPFDVVWIDHLGRWGFEGHRTTYGQQPELLDWIKRETRG